jgi:hypothetical protein
LHCFSSGTVSLSSRVESSALEAVSRSFRFLAYSSGTVDPGIEQEPDRGGYEVIGLAPTNVVAVPVL